MPTGMGQGKKIGEQLHSQFARAAKNGLQGLSVNPRRPIGRRTVLVIEFDFKQSTPRSPLQPARVEFWIDPTAKISSGVGTPNGKTHKSAAN